MLRNDIIDHGAMLETAGETLQMLDRRLDGLGVVDAERLRRVHAEVALARGHVIAAEAALEDLRRELDDGR